MRIVTHFFVWLVMGFIIQALVFGEPLRGNKNQPQIFR